MSTPGQPTDPLYTALDPLVRAQALTPEQANAVYRAIGSTGVSPAAPALGSTPSSASQPARRETSWSRSSLGTAIGVVGAGLLASAFLVSYSLAQDQLTWKPFVGMVAPIVVLTLVLAVRVYASFREDVVALGAVAGSVALLGLALAIPTTGGSAPLAYIAGAVLLVGGVTGYVVWRQQIFVVPAYLGGLVLTANGGSHFVSSSSSDQNSVLYLGVVLMLYGVLVVLAAWRLPCRHLAGVLGGGLGVSSMAFVIVLNGFTGAFVLGSTGEVMVSYRSDTVIALVLGLVVCVVLAAAYAAHRESGFLVVAGIGGATLPALAVPLLTQKHPLQLATGFLVLGSLALAAGVLLAHTRGRLGSSS